MAERIITGLDFQERNRQLLKKKEEFFEQLKSKIISIVNKEWELTADDIVEDINIHGKLSLDYVSFIRNNKEMVANWSKETLKLILFEDGVLGYSLKVPPIQQNNEKS